MDIDPLKIPAFMRRKSTKKRETTDFYRHSEIAPPLEDRPTKPALRPKRTRPKVRVQPVSLPSFVKPEPEKGAKVAKADKNMVPAGIVTQYLDKISVVIVKVGTEVLAGDNLILPGENRTFKHRVKSMQLNRKPVHKAERGQEIGIKVGKKVKVGEMVYLLD